MRISGKVISRCEICRKSGLSGFASCTHKGKRKYIAEYRIDGGRFREVVGLNKSVAEQRLNEIVNSIHTGEFFKSKKPKTTFTEFSQKWLDERVKPRVKGNTYVTYRGYIKNHLSPALCKIDIAKVTEEDLVGLLSLLLEKLGPATVNKILKVLKNIFKFSKRWKYRDDNPAWDIETFKEPHREMDYLQPKEILLLLENSRDSYRTLFLTAIFNGYA